MIALGSEVKDTITDFRGIATARAEYLSGTPRVLVEAFHDGRYLEQWFDEARLIVPEQQKYPPIRDVVR